MYLLLRGDKVLEEFSNKADAEIEAVVLKVAHPGFSYRVTSAASRAVEECLALLALGQNEKEKP
jgi:hypothetical protein